MTAGRRPARACRAAALVALAMALPVLPLLTAAPASALPAPGTGRVTRPAAPEVVLRDARGARVGVVRTAAGTAAAGRAVRASWTRERMLAARPAPVRAGAAGRGPARSAAVPASGAAGLSATTARGRVGRGTAPTAARSVPSAAVDAVGSTWNASRAALGRTTGKVFFSMGDEDYVCSASAVVATDASTVLTAGHCVDEGGTSGIAGQQATDWVFVPGYSSGRAPYGTFVASHLATTTGWHRYGDFDVDVAFANVGRNERGQTLAQAVGGQRIGFGLPRGGRAIAIGYPAASPYTGERLTYCAGTLVQDSYGGSTDQGLRCDMTGGSSGGPWVTGYDAETGSGTVVAVTSFGYDGLPGLLWGPYLGTTAKALYVAVQGSTTR